MIDDDLLKRRLKNENVTTKLGFNIFLIKIILLNSNQSYGENYSGSRLQKILTEISNG
ncbi:hypothetical protein GCM10011412_06920 [Maribacter cobaltidurans]|nr:hypothetical protein GCM10011412_06920 [Maribacter cobaltidurans]